MNSTKIGGKPTYDPPEGSTLVTNYFECHTGASRYGVGRFLMRRPDYDAIAGTSSPVALSMQSDQGDGINWNVYLAGASPAFPSNTSDDDDMVEVWVFDVRCKLVNPLIKSYNCNQIGLYPVKFYKSTTYGMDGTTEWTWHQLADDIEVDYSDASIFPSTWKPRNIIWDNIAKSRIYDDLCSRLYLIAGFDGTSIQLYAPDGRSDNNTHLLSSAERYVIKEGVTQRNTKSRLPGKFEVTFPGINPSGDDPFKQSDRAYKKDVTNSDGNSAITQSLHIGEYQAIGSSGTFSNQTELDAVANDMAARVKAAMSADIGETAYAGLWPFDLDGNIRGIRWASDQDGARTFIRINNDRDFSPLGEAHRVNETIQNMLVSGIGETRAAVTAGGTRLVWGNSDLSFWAKITNSTAISDASNRYAYSWTEQTLQRAGVWADTDSGRTSDDLGPAYNTIEANNTDSGIQGNSSDLDASPGDYMLLPVRGNPVVHMYPVVNCDGNVEYQFSYENLTANDCGGS